MVGAAPASAYSGALEILRELGCKQHSTPALFVVDLTCGILDLLQPLSGAINCACKCQQYSSRIQ